MNAFQRCWEKVENHLPFDEAWAGSTGYFEHAVKLLDLEPGERARSEDPHGRRIVFVGTPVGTCVAFERYSPQVDGRRSVVVVSNTPSVLRSFIPSGALTADDFFRNWGLNTNNIGTALVRYTNAMDDTESKDRDAC